MLELSALKTACTAYGIETAESDTLDTLTAKVKAHTFETGQLNVTNISKDKLQQIALCYELDFTATTTKAELETMILEAQNSSNE